MHPGDKVKIRTADEEVEGILMESSDENIVSLKLSSGYNIGIAKVKTKEIKIIEKFRKPKEAAGKELPFDPNKPTISILHTGGTIASKVDYRTGAVVSKFSPEDLLESFPELKDIANIKTKLVFQMFSEDMEPEHWTILAEEVKKVAEEHVDGIIITHGTDTMSYSSSALSFALQNLGIPVILVGAQRSSDRPSTDASDNLYAAAKFIAETDYSGVGVCMHETTNDNSCLIHRGVKVRKMHSSRRDAFKSINSLPIARVTKEKIEFIDKNYEKKDKTKKIELKNKFEKNIALVKIHPGQDDKEFKFYVTKFKGVVFEGTGLGHLPVTKLDVHTKHHKKILSILEKATIPMFMTSQTINGRVDMDVYSTGRDLQKAGVVGAEDMNSECAFVKLGWVLAQTQDKEQVKKMMLTNYCGEITECSKPNDNY